MIIDFHAHFYNQDWFPQKFWNGMVSRAVSVRKKSGEIVSPEIIRDNLFKHYGDSNGDVLIKEMKDAGIDVTQIMPLDQGVAFGEPAVPIAEVNHLIAEIVKRHSPRIRAYFGIDPRRQEGVSLFEKAVKEWGMTGLKLHPGTGFYPNDRLVYPLYEKAVELGVPVLFHTGATIPPFRNIYCNPIYLDDVTLDFPQLTLIAAHVSFGWWQELCFMISKKINLMADISGWQTLIRDYSLFCGYLRDMLNIAGAENLLFATDGPSFRLYGLGNKAWAQMIKNLPEKAAPGVQFSREEIDQILYKNALRVMKIDLKELKK